MSAYRDHEDLISVGAYRRGANRLVDAAIDLREEIHRFLRQPVAQRSTFEEARKGLMQIQQRYQQRANEPAVDAAAGLPGGPRAGAAAGLSGSAVAARAGKPPVGAA